MRLRASSSVGAVALDLKINGKDYKKQVSNLATQGSNQLEKSFDSTFKKIGKMAIAAFSIKALADFTASCLKLGSDLTEVQNVVDTAFPTMSASADEFAKSAMESFGLSETMAKKFMGTFGAMSNSFGFTEKEALEMSKTLTGLAGDVASFYNLDPTEAYTKLKSVFTGETETLKDLGVVMTQAALDQYALANGYGRTTAKMSEQEKVALRYAFVQDQLSMATGDFIKTQDSWANQTRILSLRFQSLKASLGKGFIALFTPIIKGINWVLSNLQVLADSFANMMEFLTGSSGDSGGGNSAVQNIANDLGVASENANNLSGGLSDAGKSAKKAAKEIASLGIDELNVFDPSSGDSDSGDSGSGTTGGSAADAVQFKPASKEATVFDSIMKGIVDEFKRLSNIFKAGFEVGFGNSFDNIERIKEYISSIGNSLKNIFTDPNVINAAKFWTDSLVSSFGGVVGSIASIGVTIATLLVGSVATYLEKNTDFIKQKIINFFDISRRIGSIVATFSVVTANIFSVFADSRFINIGSNIIQAIVNGVANTIELVLRVMENVLKAILDPLVANKEKIKGAILEFAKPFEDITNVIATKMTDWDSFIHIFGVFAGTIAGLKVFGTIIGPLTTFTTLFGKFTSAVTTSGFLPVLQGLVGTTLPGLSGVLATLLSPIGLAAAAIAGLTAGFIYLYTTSTTFRDQINGIFASIATNIGGVITGLIAIISTLWTMGVEPVITSIATGLAFLWDNGLSAFIENVSTFIANLINGIMSIWNNAINPLINMLLSIFLPIFTTVFDGILAIAIPIITKIMEYANMFMDVLNLVMQVLNEHVFPIFKVVFDGISKAVGAFWEFAKPIFDWFMKLLGQVVTFALDYFLAPLDIAFGTIVEIIKDIVDPITKTLDGVKKIFEGIIDFVTGIFTGDWDKAWEGVKKIFSGMWDTLSGIVETVWKVITGLFSNGGKIFSGVVDGIANVFKKIVNTLIDGMNKVIKFPFDKINGLLNEIRSFDIPIIGQPFKGLWSKNPLPVPQIPKLAQGGYVKANQPQLAMIGDNRHQGEIVAPEDKLFDIMTSALQNFVGSASKGGDESQLANLLARILMVLEDMDLTVNLDGEVIYRNQEKIKNRKGLSFSNI